MKIVCTSDTHNNAVQIPECDLLIHAGDLTGSGTEKELRTQLEWLASTQATRIILVPGNHDFLFERYPGLARRMCEDHQVEPLIEEGTVVGGRMVWGTPYQPWFLDWAFNVGDDAELQEHYQKIPEDTDILITHCPPRGILDRHANGDDIGSAALFKRLIEIKNSRGAGPWLHVFGHAHCGYGVTTLGMLNTLFINAAACNECYQAVNQPITIRV